MNYRFCLLLTFILSCSSLFSQKIENLNSSDTLYYYFKHKSNENKSRLRDYAPPNIKSLMFRVDVANIPHLFNYVTHKKIGNIEIPLITKPKSFLKKNRDKIICYTILKKMHRKSLLENLFWNSRNKVIYIIDKQEIENEEIVLRKVSWNSPYPIQQ